MDKLSANKHRTPSRCREWERQRRMKFNDAITKLGELVKSINKTNSTSIEDVDNVQYPKIEIVQKAIICLTNFIQEKTQLKAEILALEIKLEGMEKKKPDSRDVSLQVAMCVNKNSQNSKYVKLLMLQKSKQKNVKDKEINKICEKKKKNCNIVNKFPPKLPKLLPLSHMKKENTFVMLPATPYIFPQRPVIFPQPPTIVLVDSSLQPLNKSTTIPIVNRNTNDITKTTMVNVLPISAYSHPLSEKNKRTTAKPRTSVTKRGAKRVSQIKENPNKSRTKKEIETKSDENKIGDQEKEITLNIQAENIDTDKTSSEEKSVKNDNDKKEQSIEPNLRVSNVEPNQERENKIENNLSKKIHGTDKIIDIPKCSESSTIKESTKITPEQAPQIPVTEEKPVTITIMDAKSDKIPPDKPIQDYKSKDSKIQNILDPTICENVVDGGNARLELAEEFLAASPTAAFLMSFPLVSGNRADSPAEESQANHAKESHHRIETLPQPVSYFEKSNLTQNKNKPNKPDTENHNIINPVSKSNDQTKFNNNNKSIDAKVSTSVSSIVTNENPFLNLPLPSIIPSSCTLADASFTIDFDCNVSKSVTTQVTTYSTTSNNIFYKGDPFNTVKSSIYSTSTIASGHEYNTLGLYPCAMENYSNKNKTDFTNVEDNLMKINSSRLTYDIDLGWSHKGFDFVNCTTSANTFHKENILTNTSTPFSSAYNPFNPEFHVPLVPSSNKKNLTSKPNAFPEQITTFYNQGTNLWSEDLSSIHTNSNVSKNFISKQQNYFPTEHLHSNSNLKTSAAKTFDTKQINENASDGLKPTSVPVPAHQLVEKYTKKSPSKMHINWMTSEIRPMQNTCNQSQAEIKESIKASYSQNEQVTKKNIQSDGNYFPINMHHFPPQPNHEELNVWPTTRPAGTTEISMEPPPINLPTLVGDLALGPHEKKKNEALNRALPHTDLQNWGNFLSVTQLMNRSNENLPLRPNGLAAETQKSISSKQNISHALNDGNRKTRLDNHPQICYGFSDSKVSHSYESVNHFSQPKAKPSKPDKSSKSQKNSYSAEALIRGGTTYSQKVHDSSAKFMMHQKYNDFNITQDSGVAQVSHFPPILDYTDNSYTGQQFSGTTLYNSTTNTISNSFYSNFMPGSSNLMTSNYAGGPFPTDFVDYNQSTDCNNYTNHKYDSKLRNNAATYQEKESTNYKSSRRETAAKHKLECSKKDSSKKYQSKRVKLGNEVDEWNDTSHLFWQNKAQSKKHQNMISEELAFPNYMGNQMHSQYQPDFFNSHIMQSNIQNVGSNTDRTLSGIPVASRANFNLSALFPEITMKVQ